MFGFLINLFDVFLYKPIFNFLVLVYNYFPLHDFGLSIIIVTVVIRFILYFPSVKALNSQIVMQKLQPQINEIQKKYKNDKEKLAQETLELYRKEKINPFSGLFLILIQLPILIALYKVFSDGLKPEELLHLYSFVPNPEHINPLFLGLMDLSNPNVIFAVLAGLVQFLQTKMLLPKINKEQKKNNDVSSIVQKQMVYFSPFITIAILFKLPSALGLYWIASGVFSIIQQYLIIRNDSPPHHNKL